MKDIIQEINQIEANELYNMFKSNKINVIDIRELFEHKIKSLDGTFNIPMRYLVKEHKEHLDNDKIYYLLCRSGARSTHLTHYLSSLGYNVVNIKGGFVKMTDMKKDKTK
ncbi:MAG: rhodanese-like domain-containing protein [Candidatus Izemoplasma sp.]